MILVLLDLLGHLDHQAQPELAALAHPDLLAHQDQLVQELPEQPGHQALLDHQVPQV